MCSLFRSKTIWCVLLLTPIFCASCDPEERHKILTTFFDGVPPLYEEEVYVQDPNSIFTVAKKPVAVWYIHEPQKDCAVCHGEKKERTFSSEVQLPVSVPELCYGCHEGLRSSDKRYIHGPVAVAKCLVCHEPHKTQNKHLLKYPVPQICYNCHNTEWTATISGHELEEYKQCLDCHSGHDSRQRYLLKEDWDKRNSSKTEGKSKDDDIAIIEKELVDVINYF